MNSSLPDCEAPERDLLEAFADGALDASAAQRFSSHLEGCNRCQVDLNGLRAFEGAMEASHLTTSEVVEAAWEGLPNAEEHLRSCSVCRGDVEAVRKARLEDSVAPKALPFKAANRMWWPAALAATVLVGVAVVVLVSRDSSRFRSEEETGSSTSRGSSPIIDGLVPQGQVSRDASGLTFSWNGRAQARYAVSFLSSDGRLIARLEVDGTKVLLTDETRRLLLGEAAFYWKVEAIGVNGAGSESAIAHVTWPR